MPPFAPSPFLSPSRPLLLILVLIGCGRGSEGGDDTDTATSTEGDGPDADGDGHGERVDCDDTDPAVYPGAQERCDGINNDCDAAIDEPDALDALDWYRDADTDGFGDPAVSTRGCARPPGFVADRTDCDDTSAAAYPGAEEVCGDGVDNDCDADPRDCLLEGSQDLGSLERQLAGAAAADGAGTALAVADLDGDGLAELLVGAPFADDGSNSDAGAVYGVAGPLSGSQSLSGGGGVRLTIWGGDRSHNVGLAFSAAGDVDGDGYADLLLSAPGAEGDHIDAGEGYLLQGPLSGSHRLPGTAALAATFIGEASYNRAGAALWGGGDVDGDGQADLLLGAERYGPSETYQGAVYVLVGPHTGTVNLAEATTRIVGSARYDRLGAAVTAGDFDGDGRSDPVAAGWSYPQGGGSGLVAVFSAPPAGEVPVTAADATFTGETEDGHFGQSLSVGDVNGDGHDDLLVGAPFDPGEEDEAGAAYLLLGPLGAGGAVRGLADATFLGAREDDEAGWAVACDGDFSGDGHHDVLLGAPGDRTAGSDAGSALLLYGPLEGTLALSTAADLILVGARSRQEAGRALTLAWDASGHGLHDIVVGAPQDSTASNSAGRVYILPGTGP